MATDARRTAVIIGASSGIGAALACELDRQGWRLGLLARRRERLDALARTLAPGALVHAIDVTHDEAAAGLQGVLDELGGADLVVISAGAGHNNRQLAADLDAETVGVNVQGFMAMARIAMRHFLSRGHGHLVGVTSVAALRGNASGAAYAASKAFQSVYLDGLRELARQSGLPITITDVQPGFVDTAMMKPERPLLPFARRLLVASPDTAARQIVRAIRRRAAHAYVTRRYGLIAFVLKRLPRPG